MAFRPFYEYKNILGKIIGRDLITSKEDAVSNYINSGRISIYPENFTGSYADLQALITRETGECEAWVKSQGALRSSANTRAACSDQIQSLYASVLIDRQGEAYANDQSATSQLLGGNNTIYLIAAVALIIILIVLYR